MHLTFSFADMPLFDYFVLTYLKTYTKGSYNFHLKPHKTAFYFLCSTSLQFEEKSIPTMHLKTTRGRAYLFDFPWWEGFSTFESIDEARQYAESQTSKDFVHDNDFSIQADPIQCI